MKTNFRLTAVIMLFALSSGFGGAYLYQKFNPSKTVFVSSNERTPVKLTNFNMSVPENAVDFTAAAEMSIHAVVHVKTQVRENVPLFNDPWGFWGNQVPSQERIQKGFGSGVIITDNGYIVTNNHVIEGADNVEVTLNDNRTLRAKVVGADPSTDIALLKVDEKNLPYITYGNSDDVKIGQWVLAVGNPFNLTSTVTAGIVSAKSRNNILQGNSRVESFIQTDAAVNPGNSGGALVNTRGELIGINAAIASNTGSYAGYSFAIPVNLVKKVIADMIEFGTVQRAYLGVNLRDVDSDIAEDKKLKDISGAYIENVMNGSAAEDAGIKRGDVVIKVDDLQVKSVPQLQEQIAKHRPGDKVNITVVRDGEEKIYAAVLENREGTTGLVKASSSTVSVMGAVFENLSDNEREKLNVDGGAKIKKLAPGKLRNAGIREGFVITLIDKKPVLSTDDVVDALKDKKGGVLIEGIYLNGMKAYYGFGL
jgi:Do/DeqQ family serine protease